MQISVGDHVGVVINTSELENMDMIHKDSHIVIEPVGYAVKHSTTWHMVNNQVQNLTL